jgi:ribonucleoside-diphosphate reductase alpha chain
MVWSDGCDPCGETVVVVESPCLPAADCCGGAVVMVDGAAEGVVVGSEVADAVAVSPSDAVVAQPTPAAEQPTTEAVAESKAVELERVPPQPATDPSGVRTTSAAADTAAVLERAGFRMAENPSASVDDRQSQFAKFQIDAPACDNCGSITVRNGNCYLCHNCGNSMGCS